MHLEEKTGQMTTAKRYASAPDGGFGWWIVLLDTSGCLAILSDYGDYTYRWGLAGMPQGKSFEQFLTTAGSDYLINKLSPKEFSPTKTADSLKKWLNNHENSTITDAYDEGRDFLESADSMHNELDYYDLIRQMHESEFYSDVDPSEHWCRDYSGQAKVFFKTYWPQVVEQIKGRT